MEKLGNKVFYECYNMVQASLSDGIKIKTLPDDTFSCCRRLEMVFLPEGITAIGKNAFKGCKKLKSITLKTTSLKKVGKYAFKGISSQPVFTCPKKKLTKYRKLIRNSKTGKNVKYAAAKK